MLLDEPTANLDPESTELAESMVAGYLSDHGASAIWISHDPRQIERVSDRHLVLAAGTLTRSGPKAA